MALGSATRQAPSAEVQQAAASASLRRRLNGGVSPHMARLNPEIDYVQELRQLRGIYVAAPPQARWNVIAQRLEQAEIGPVRLLTVVSAVEALARAILLEVQSRAGTDKARLYDRHKSKEPHVLVEHLFAEVQLPAPSTHFPEDTWDLFRHAVNFRNLVVHECTYLGQDKYRSLIAAGEEVLGELVKIGGIRVKGAA